MRLGGTSTTPRERPRLPLRRADVLMICPDSDWWRTRCHLRIGLLEEQGITVCLYQPRNNSLHQAWDAITIVQPTLVMSHAEAIDGMNLSDLARRFPDVTFASVNHSSQSHLANAPHGLKSNAAHVSAALGLDNYIYATPDERVPLAAIHAYHPNLQWAPNPVRTPTKERAGRPGKDALLLAGRADMVKNLPQQLMAAALLQHDYHCDVLVTIKQPQAEQSVEHLARAYGLRLQFVPWMNWPDWIDFINARVTLCLQASYTESFNYVALENMLCGRPVIGSEAIRYLPPEWRVNPESPEQMAQLGRSLLDDWKPHSLHARQMSHDYADHLNQSYVAWALSLCSGAFQAPAPSLLRSTAPSVPTNGIKDHEGNRKNQMPPLP